MSIVTVQLLVESKYQFHTASRRAGGGGVVSYYNVYHPLSINTNTFSERLFLTLAQLFGTVCLKLSATLILPLISRPPSYQEACGQ